MEYRSSKGIPYVTIRDVYDDLGEQAARRLEFWMRGQTMALAENGDVMIYAWDYERWLRAAPIID